MALRLKIEMILATYVRMYVALNLNTVIPKWLHTVKPFM